MKKSSKDVKFVIYQVLYIFVVCVIALKGANLDLVEVVDSKTVVDKTIADELKKQIDSLLALGLVPELKKEDLQKVSEVDIEKLQNDFRIYKETYTKKESDISKVVPETPKEEKPIDKTKTQAKVKGVELTQYTRPKLTNPYDKPMEISADGKLLASIPVGGSAVLTLNGESSVKFKVGDNSDVVPTKVNLAPKVSMERYITSGEDASVNAMQNRVGYRITITDDILANLDVSITGSGLEVKQVGTNHNIYDVTLKMFPNEKTFDAWSKGKNFPYKVMFTVNVKDKYNPNHKLNQVGVFTFGKW